MGRLTRARSRLPLAGAILAALASTSPGLGADEGVCGRAVTSREQIAAELAGDAKLKPVPNGGPDFDAYVQEQPLQMWFITKPHYPEIQAVICRFIEEENGQRFLAVQSRCAGPKPLCDRLIAYFSKPTN